MHTVQFLSSKNVFAIETVNLKHFKIVLGLNVITSFDFFGTNADDAFVVVFNSRI